MANEIAGSAGIVGKTSSRVNGQLTKKFGHWLLMVSGLSPFVAVLLSSLVTIEVSDRRIRHLEKGISDLISKDLIGRPELLVLMGEINRRVSTLETSKFIDRDELLEEKNTLSRRVLAVENHLQNSELIPWAAWTDIENKLDRRLERLENIFLYDGKQNKMNE